MGGMWEINVLFFILHIPSFSHLQPIKSLHNLIYEIANLLSICSSKYNLESRSEYTSD
jgi:hypothetical protein